MLNLLYKSARLWVVRHIVFRRLQKSSFHLVMTIAPELRARLADAERFFVRRPEHQGEFHFAVSFKVSGWRF